MKSTVVTLVLFLSSVVGIRNTNLETMEATTIKTEKTAVTVGTAGATELMRFEERRDQGENARFQASRLILVGVYEYDEIGKHVEALQNVLGNVRVDGHYGAATRKSHLKALRAAGLPTDNVPVVHSREGVLGKYNIPDNLEERCPMWEDKFREHGLEPVEVFSYIAYRESRCNPKAVNAKWDANGKVTWTLNKDGSIDRGLVQINSTWLTVTSQVCKAPRGNLNVLFDVDCNLKVAKYLMDNTESKLGNWRVFSSK